MYFFFQGKVGITNAKKFCGLGDGCKGQAVVLEGPVVVLEGPVVVLEGPAVVLEGPVVVLEGRLLLPT